MLLQGVYPRSAQVIISLERLVNHLLKAKNGTIIEKDLQLDRLISQDGFQLAESGTTYLMVDAHI